MKKRIDSLIFEKGLTRSRNSASDLIANGKVFFAGNLVKKSSEQIDEERYAEISIIENQKYVSRAGYKLEKALEEFKVNVKDKTALDIGASTGGFTDCLLQNNAKKVISVDVGTDQMDKTVKNNPKVISLEKTDIRKVDKLPDNEIADLIVIDASFISLTLILPHLNRFLKKNGDIIALIKPQFELSKADLTRSGIVRNSKLQVEALNKIVNFCKENNFEILGQIDSPILGSEGNKEFLIHLKILGK